MRKSITKRQINTSGLVGELFTPQGQGPFPAALCIGGSSGGVKTAAAPLLAEAGFVALSLGYFGAPGLLKEFAELPLEYFVQGVDWLLAQPMVRGRKVGVTGTSRGSEAALQAATLTPHVGSVVAYVPSGIRWMGVAGRPSWTYNGKPLPYVQWPNDFDKGGAIAKVDRFKQILDNPAVWASAEIAIEKAACPLLLISGKNDQLWPSERMANLIMERLKKHSYPHHYEHIAYPNAGHRIKVPGLDPSSYEPVSEDTVTHEILSLGGTYEGNKLASEQSWNETVSFLRSALG
ncbi:MAG TPA: acyl-CoA thioester hydrolase/BAAT C-terminal domain-containing protein [Candidatus Saccharimonadales bacterium]|nr:acyl-CoA thioester hydrolase/BAAT C-terminal domain-containing protein [Candidatus Saccharimonadales bacterium]